jgi:hypothetical protein
MEPSLGLKNETKLIKKVYRIEPQMADASEVDITKIDWMQNPFSIQQPMFDPWHHIMDDMVTPMTKSCQGFFWKRPILGLMAKIDENWLILTAKLDNRNFKR